jgi:four helix bundle protein
MVQDFKRLQIWENAVSFHKSIISELAKFPPEEKYAMGSQMRRASLSISNNIAEGCGKASNKEFRAYLLNAMGSCKEVESMLNVALELGYITQLTFNKLNEEINTLGKQLNVFIRKISENEQ